MPRNHIEDMHSDAWWMRVMDGALTQDEERRWRAHLAGCQMCRLEWDAIARVDLMLRTAAPPPVVPEAFTLRTVATITRKQKLRRLLSFMAGFVIFTIVAWVGIAYFDVTLASVVHTINSVISSRRILLEAFVRTLVGLTATVQTFLPLMFGIAGASLLLVAPNSLMATAVFVWYRRRHSRNSAAS